jgi:hypothetical protein
MRAFSFLIFLEPFLGTLKMPAQQAIAGTQGRVECLTFDSRVSHF